MRGLAASVDALPKVELHCHLEGTMRPTTLVELARPSPPASTSWGSSGSTTASRSWTTPGLVRRMAADRIPLTVCPTSNVEACWLDATAKAALR